MRDPDDILTEMRDQYRTADHPFRLVYDFVTRSIERSVVLPPPQQFDKAIEQLDALATAVQVLKRTFDQGRLESSLAQDLLRLESDFEWLVERAESKQELRRRAVDIHVKIEKIIDQLTSASREVQAECEPLAKRLTDRILWEVFGITPA